MFIGGDGGDDSKQKEERQEIRKENKMIEKLFGLSMEAWKNFLSEFSKLITKFSGMGRFTYPWCSTIMRLTK